MKVLRVLLVAVLAITLVVGTSGCKSTTPDETSVEPMKIAWIYPGPHNDGGYSQAHDNGRLYVQENVSDVETAYSELVSDDMAEKVCRDYASQGYKLIFATSFGMMKGMMAAAKDFPDVTFMHASGYPLPTDLPNMGIYFGRLEQPDYLAGLVAGKMTKTNYIGFVLPFSIPECIREVNSFTTGVREVNSKAEVHVIYTNSWVDPVKEKAAAEAHLAAGADIIASGCDTPASLEAAYKAGKYGVGYDMDAAAAAVATDPAFAKSVLTSRVWNWGPYYKQVVEEVKAGTWKQGDYWGGMTDGIVDLAPMSEVVPQAVKDLVEARKQEILQGTFDPFMGPQYDQAGTLRIPAGQTLNDQEQRDLQWFVKGVVGDIPKGGS